MTSPTDILVAKETFSVTLDGVPTTVTKGQTRVRVGHPLIKGREMYFEPLTVQYDLEQATSAPGEKRGDPAPDKAELLKAATRAANAARAEKASTETRTSAPDDNGESADPK